MLFLTSTHHVLPLFRDSERCAANKTVHHASQPHCCSIGQSTYYVQDPRYRKYDHRLNRILVGNLRLSRQRDIYPVSESPLLSSDGFRFLVPFPDTAAPHWRPLFYFIQRTAALHGIGLSLQRNVGLDADHIAVSRLLPVVWCASLLGS